MSTACEEGLCPDCSGKTIDQMCEELKMMRRYQDFVRELASRDHDRSCPANEHCTCIVGEAADVVMGIKR